MKKNKDLNPKGLEELFVPYNISKELLEKDFNEPCFGVIYSDGYISTGSYGQFAEIMIKRDKECIKAITCEQAVRWFRDKHKLIIGVSYFDSGNSGYLDACSGYIRNIKPFKHKDIDKLNVDYYKALIEAIEVALKQIK